MSDAALLVIVFLAPFLTRLLCRWRGLVKPNFRGERIPAALGLTFVLIVLGHTALLLGSSRGQGTLLGGLFVLLVFGSLGCSDDLWGNRAVGGFRGHLKSLVALRPTTGALKLVGGGLASLWFVWPLERQTWLQFPVGAALIALAANTVNLLDLRPGRALFGFALLLVPGWRSAVMFWPVLLGALVEWPFDARAKGMLGDTGSNVLGALAGMAAVVSLSLRGQIALLCLLLVLNALSEWVSITATIDKTPWLRWIDRRLGVR